MEEQIEQKEERISKIRDMKSDLILNAAFKVFSQKGIYETRLEDIAAEAGFSKASLYNYYPNKETIIYNLATREFEHFIGQLNNSPEYKISEEQSLAKNLRKYLFLSLITFGKHFHFIASMNIFEIIKEQNPNESEDMEKNFCCLKNLRDENGLLKILGWARNKNEIKTKIDNVSLCRFIDAAIIGTIHEWWHDKKVGDIEKASENLCELLISGMGKL